MAKQPRPRVNRKGGRCVGTIVQWEAILFFFFTFHRQGCVCVCARVDLIDRRDFERGLFDYFEFNELIVKRLDSDQVWGQCSAMCFGWYKIRGGRATTATWTAKETFTRQEKKGSVLPLRGKEESWKVSGGKRGGVPRGRRLWPGNGVPRRMGNVTRGRGRVGLASRLSFSFPLLPFLSGHATRSSRMGLDRSRSSLVLSVDFSSLLD